MAKKKEVVKEKEGLDEFNFLNNVETNDGDTLMLEMGKYITALLDAEDDVKAAETILKQKQQVYRKLSEEILPDFMQSAGFESIKTAQGIVTLKEDVKARIPADPFAQQRAFDWLKENGAGPLIKSEISIQETEEQKLSTDLIDKLTSLGLSFSKSDAVNTNSLQAYFRDLLGMKQGSVVQMDIADIPKEFSLFHYRKVTVKSN